ncbi:MAG: transcription-repair coupling factor, partial [Desulfatitalea sp.]|nr:transcription-repair coupling factor [Desulfatitalea sp.]
MGLGGSAIPYAATQIYKRHRLPLLLVTATTKAAGRLIEDLTYFLKDELPPILYFPPYNLLPFKFMAYHNETAGQRVRTLYQIMESSQAPIVVTTVGGLMQHLLPKNALGQFTELVVAGEELDRDGLVQKLVAGGYSRAAIVEESGDFALRGGLLDLFSPLYSDPLRIEFYGDMVESIRLFSADSQRTIKNMDEVVILPAREVIMAPAELNAILGRLRTRAAELGVPVTKTREMAQRIKTEGFFPGMESLLPLIYPRLDTLLDYLPAATLALLIDPGELAGTADEIESQTARSFQGAKGRDRLFVEPEALYLSGPQFQKRLEPHGPLAFKMLSIIGQDNERPTPAVCHTSSSETLDVRGVLQAAGSQQRPFQPLVDWLNGQTQAGHNVLTVCRRPSHVERLAQTLISYDMRTSSIGSVTEMPEGRGRIYLTTGGIGSGFVWPEAGLALISDEDIFGTAYRPRKVDRSAKAVDLLNIEDLHIGDFVVHAEHGIGQYEGLVKLGVERSINDYLLIVYRDGDKLYLPVERMHTVQKYLGVEGVAPVLDKMGGTTWERIKDKVKRSTEKIAGELLQLYASRKVQKGHAFGAVDTYFRDFEEGFPFEETVDQRKAIEDVLQDMRQATPMDR